MEELQFYRTYELIIGEVGSGRGLKIIGDEKTERGLQISFSVSKNIDNKETSNDASFTLTNLAESSIDYINRPEMAIIFKCGYNGNNKLLFKGIIKEITTDTYQGGTDRQTKIKAVPMDSLTYKSTISKSFPADTTPRQIINNIIGSSEVIKKGSFNSDNLDTPFPFGYSVEGSAKSIINQLATDFDFQYRLDNDRLYISDEGGYESQNSVTKATVFSPNTGLVGVPTYASPDGKEVKDSFKKKDGVKFSALLNADVRPSSAIKLDKTKITGVFRVDSVKFSGDWRGGSWNMECMCSKVITR